MALGTSRRLASAEEGSRTHTQTNDARQLILTDCASQNGNWVCVVQLPIGSSLHDLWKTLPLPGHCLQGQDSRQGHDRTRKKREKW
jgi:hypothetical protein